MRTTLTSNTFASPVPEAKRWIEGLTFSDDLPLINVSQAAPVAPPEPALIEAMAQALQEPTTHIYSPDLGLPDLRAEMARKWSALYGGQVAPHQVAITSGCNQAFAAAIAATCAQGDNVIVPTPWYFNHKMWLDMAGVETVPLPTDADGLPDPGKVTDRISARTRAIVLVTPNNPTGVTCPPELIERLFELSRDHRLKLIIDETYRDFLDGSEAPHDLLLQPDWDETVIQLYSFSKAYRMTGHRVGALIGAASLMPEVEKFIDTVTICPSVLGQRGALFALQHLDASVAAERALIARRRKALAKGFKALKSQGWVLKGLGAYFAYVEHPFSGRADQVARALVKHAAILALPGTMFVPYDDPSGARHLRLACANIDEAQIAQMFERLAAFRWPLAPGGGPA